MEFEKNFRELENLNEEHMNRYDEYEAFKNGYFNKLMKSRKIFDKPNESEIKKIFIEEGLVLDMFCADTAVCQGLNLNFKNKLDHSDLDDLDRIIMINDAVTRDYYSQLTSKKAKDLGNMAKQFNNINYDKKSANTKSISFIKIKLNPIKIPSPKDIGRELGGVLDSTGNVINDAGKIVINVVKETANAARDLVEGTGQELNKLKLFIEENGEKFNYWVNHNVGHDLNNIERALYEAATWTFCGGKHPEKKEKDPNDHPNSPDEYEDSTCMKISLKVNDKGDLEVGNENGDFGGIPDQHDNEISEEQLQWMRDVEKQDMLNSMDFTESLDKWIQDRNLASQIQGIMISASEKMNNLLEKKDNNSATKAELSELKSLSSKIKEMYDLIKIADKAAGDRIEEIISGMFDVEQSVEQIGGLCVLLWEKGGVGVVDSIDGAIQEYYSEYRKETDPEEKAKLIGRMTADLVTILLPTSLSTALGKKILTSVAANVNKNGKLTSIIQSADKLNISNSSQLKVYSSAQMKKINVNSGKQGVHIPGHNNFIAGRSEFTHPNPKELIDNHAGKGQWYGQNKEVINFNERIGVWVSPQGERLKTTRGTIHYNNKGEAHIVPAHPTGT